MTMDHYRTDQVPRVSPTHCACGAPIGLVTDLGGVVWGACVTLWNGIQAGADKTSSAALHPARATPAAVEADREARGSGSTIPHG
jgi:hypothetical protein